MDSTHLTPNLLCQRRPLCCRYCLVHFAIHPLPVRAAAGASVWPVAWALGSLNDGQREVLGVWRNKIEGEVDWQTIFCDLAARGVEEIRFAAQVDPTVARTTFPRMKGLNDSSSECDEPESSALRNAPTSTETIGTRCEQWCDLSTSPRRVQLLARRGEEALQQFKRGLMRAVARQGVFDSALAAEAFVESWLMNAERREDHRQSPARRRPGIAEAVQH